MSFPVTAGAFKLAAVPVVLSLPAAWLSPVAGIGLVILAAFVLVFHRDPARTPPEDGIVAPADGTVSVLRSEGDRIRVGTFMNVYHVHVNRSPISGTVTDLTHVDGGHWPAFMKDSDENERVHIDLETPIGDVRVTQIAGTVARRIHPGVTPEQQLEAGDRIGHISFGSRVDVLLPPTVDKSDLCVATGDRVRAGESHLVDHSLVDSGASDK